MREILKAYGLQVDFLRRIAEASEGVVDRSVREEAKGLLQWSPEVYLGDPTSGFQEVCLVWNAATQPENYWTGLYLGESRGRHVVMTCKHASPTIANGTRVAMPVQYESDRGPANIYVVSESVCHERADACLLFIPPPLLPGAPAGSGILARKEDYDAVVNKPEDHPLTFCGFGYYKDPSRGPGVKRVSKGATVWSSVPANVGYVPDIEFVAGGTQNGATRDVCRGDSGGAVWATVNGVEKVIGIVARSVGEPCGPDGGIFTRVDVIRDWIQKTAGI